MKQSSFARRSFICAAQRLASRSQFSGKVFKPAFSMIQTTVALAILAMLLVFVLPQYSGFIDDARDARLKAMASGLRAAVFLAREKWVAADKGDERLAGFGNNDLLMSPYGWPVGVIEQGKRYRLMDITQATQMSATAEHAVDKAQSMHRVCQKIWRALLVDGAPQADIELGAAEMLARAEQQRCRFYMGSYSLETSSATIRFIEYHPANGRVVWKIR